jgi:hypothetical protein
MNFLNTYLTFISVMFFVGVQAQKNRIFSSNHTFFNAQYISLKNIIKPINLGDDILNCQKNVKLCIDKSAKILLRNTFYMRKIGYISEEGIVFKTGKRLQLVLWYGT